MNLQCQPDLAASYKSRSQIARILTEDWCERELYCAACPSNTLRKAKANAATVDFFCAKCEQPYQLKSRRNAYTSKITDAAYDPMIRAIRQDRTPNLLFLQYSNDWAVSNLLLVPSFFFSESIIEKRKPLGPDAKRAGWVGCNILLGDIVADGRISLVSDGIALPTKDVRRRFDEMRALSNVRPETRGWTLDVLKIVREIGKDNFTLSEAYEYADELQALHPHNQHVRPKIRQQLQILRDLGFLRFVTPGQYAIIKH
ncbi:MAG: DpnI domain-containing protein [Terriglobales bacterium]|jgi:type II restriction enzyme